MGNLRGLGGSGSRGLRDEKETTASVATPAAVEEAVAVVYATEGNSAHGIVRFHEVKGGVEVSADISGLPPDSDHGFHIHEFGDASGRQGDEHG